MAAFTITEHLPSHWRSPKLLLKPWQCHLIHTAGPGAIILECLSKDAVHMTGVCCLIFPARGQGSSCLTCTTLTLWQKWLHSCHDNLEKAQGTSLPELEKSDNSWHDPTSNVHTLLSCRLAAVGVFSIPGQSWWVPGLSWAPQAPPGWVQPVWSPALPHQGTSGLWSNFHPFHGDRKRIRQQMENMEKTNFKWTPCI